MNSRELLLEALKSGATTTCQAWSILRADGVNLGFTDHDQDITFDGIIFKADTGMTARVLQQTNGLSANNSEAIGALSDSAISEIDISAGRFDDAEVRNWLVDWTNVEARIEQFRGTIGEISRSNGEFRAELRGLTEKLERVRSRFYQKSCGAILGDVHCRIDLNLTAYSAEVELNSRDSSGRYSFNGLSSYQYGWFERGQIRVVSGPAAGLIGLIKYDKQIGDVRQIELWMALPISPTAGDLIRVEAGCDKAAQTCKSKFANFLNFRGFPHLPGEDWLASYPVSTQAHNGESLVK